MKGSQEEILSLTWPSLYTFDGQPLFGLELLLLISQSFLTLACRFRSLAPKLTFSLLEIIVLSEPRGLQLLLTF